ncbi:MAG: hypothetical protein JO142_10435 [Burkholderiales bacterium]|nr:hypothetical protein [Burkholderiales bacterium]
MQNFLEPRWPAIESYLKKELERARIKLEDPVQSDHSTAMLRGEIAALKKLLDFPRMEAQRINIKATIPGAFDE